MREPMVMGSGATEVAGMVELARYAADGFEATVHTGNRALLVRLAGCVDAPAGEVFTELVQRAHAEARDAGAGAVPVAVAVDVRGLEFLNAAGFATLAGWVELLRALGAAERYRLTFRTAASMAWQARNLRGLCNLAPELVALQDD